MFLRVRFRIPRFVYITNYYIDILVIYYLKLYLFRIILIMLSSSIKICTVQLFELDTILSFVSFFLVKMIMYDV